MVFFARTSRPAAKRIAASVRLWALAVSVGLHLMALAALGMFHFARRGEAASAHPSEISVHTIERIIEQPQPKPKPQIEPLPEPTVSPLPAEPPAPLQEPVCPPEKSVSAVAAAPKSVEPNLFFGSKTSAGRVCYVVDGSGSMFGLMYLVRQQLRDSILKLSPEQSFNVVFFMSDGALVQAFESRLETATPAAKTQALNLLGRIRPEGQTSAERALDAVMRTRDRQQRSPEVIYLVTDGFDLMDGAGDAFIRRIKNLRKNLAPAAIIHTIGIYPAQQDGTILADLAQACGGRYIEVN